MIKDLLKKKKTVVELLDTLTDKVANDLVNDHRSSLFFVNKNGNEFVFKNYRIIKNKDGTYTVLNKTKTAILYSNLCLFESAVGIVEALTLNRRYNISSILNYDGKYGKFYMDMLHFKMLMSNKDDRYAIFDARYSDVVRKAEFLRQQIHSIRKLEKI